MLNKKKLFDIYMTIVNSNHQLNFIQLVNLYKLKIYLI